MKKIFIIALALMFLLTGCGNTYSKEINLSNNIYPNLTAYGQRNGFAGYWYLVDNNTGVVYLEYSGDKRHALTVMLNADGTPVTKDQLELEDE